MSEHDADDETCTDCWGTGWNGGLERVCDCQPAEARQEAEPLSEVAQLRAALGSVRRAILEAPAGIIGDTLWCVDSPNETVIDRIDSALQSAKWFSGRNGRKEPDERGSYRVDAGTGEGTAGGRR